MYLSLHQGTFTTTAVVAYMEMSDNHVPRVDLSHFRLFMKEIVSSYKLNRKDETIEHTVLGSFLRRQVRSGPRTRSRARLE